MSKKLPSITQFDDNGGQSCARKNSKSDQSWIFTKLSKLNQIVKTQLWFLDIDTNVEHPLDVGELNGHHDDLTAKGSLNLSKTKKSCPKATTMWRLELLGVGKMIMVKHH